MFNAETTALALDEACGLVGLDPSHARLLRLGTNAVYRLTSPVVVRVSRSSCLQDIARVLAVAHWLKSVDFPAVRPIDVEQPVVIDGTAITFWEALSDNGDVYASAAEVAELLVRLHRLYVPSALDLPLFDPFNGIERRIRNNSWLNERDRVFLSELLVGCRSRYADLHFALSPGVIHGDANVGNVLRDRSGNPVVIDLDGFSIGPREWDLIQTAIFYSEFGWHTRKEYDSFIAVYGFDITRWDGYSVLRDIRELHMVTWLIQNAANDSAVAEESEKRIRSLRTGASRRDWAPY